VKEFDLGMLNCFAEIENNQTKYFDTFNWNMLGGGGAFLLDEKCSYFDTVLQFAGKKTSVRIADGGMEISIFLNRHSSYETRLTVHSRTCYLQLLDHSVCTLVPKPAIK